jgi:pyridoxine kinase
MPHILSIQSWVATGHVGNAAAMLPLQVLGAEVTAIHTVQFSNHPGHGGFTGRAAPAGEIASLVAGLAAHGTLARADGVLSGYLGQADVGHEILNAVSLVRAGKPDALYCCDPVIGDDGRAYVRPGVADFFAGPALAAADILTPNQFELDHLSGLASGSWAQARAAAITLRARLRPAGPRLVLVTSLRTAETPDAALDMLLAATDGIYRLRANRLPMAFSGAGDTLAALLLFHVLDGKAPQAAAAHAASSLAGLLRRTYLAGSAELLTVAAQDEFTLPSVRITAEAA